MLSIQNFEKALKLIFHSKTLIKNKKYLNHLVSFETQINMKTLESIELQN